MPFTTQCSATALAAGSVPDIPFTACADASVIFSFQNVGTGPGAISNYILILADADQSLAAAKFWPASDFPHINDGSSTHQQYAGEKSFVVKP